jgi:hypothetical protein
MHPQRAELSSLSTLLDDVVDRITAAAERADAAKEETLATDLFAVERALAGARRRLVGAIDRLA